MVSFWQDNLPFLRIRVLPVKYGDVADHAGQMTFCSAFEGSGYLRFLFFPLKIDKFDFYKFMTGKRFFS